MDRIEEFKKFLRAGQFDRGYAVAYLFMAASCTMIGVVELIVSRKEQKKADEIWHNNLNGHIYVDKEE